MATNAKYEVNLKKGILKVIHCFKGPVRQTFLYTYYQAYSQDTDVYNYAINSGKDSLFSPKELQILKNERRPAHLSLPLLYKVIQTCCSPALAEHDSGLWTSHEIISTYSTINRIEQMLRSFLNSYSAFLRNAFKLSIMEIDNIIESLRENVSVALEKAGEILGTRRWTEENDHLQKVFLQIKSGDLLPYWKSVKDIIKVEAEFRVDMYREQLGKELQDVDSVTWHLEQLGCDSEGEISTEDFKAKECIQTESLFKFASEKGKRVFWIAGEHGVGKSIFAAYIASCWSSNDNKTAGIEKFNTVIVISLHELVKECSNVSSLVLPLTNLLVDSESVESWLTSEHILIIIDDVNIQCEKAVKQFNNILSNAPNLNVWFMGNMSCMLKYAKIFSHKSDEIFLELRGLHEQRILTISEGMKRPNSDDTLKNKLKSNMNRLGYILKYPTISDWTFQLWKSNPELLKNIYNSSELMWEILAWKVKQILKINIKKIGGVRKKFLSWLMLAGELAFCCLKAGISFDKQSLEELENEIVSIFKEKGKHFLEFFFKPTVIHSYASCFAPTASTCKPFLEYLSSWFFIDQLLKDKQMSNLTSGLACQLPIILFATGHLERFYDEESITIPEFRKAIKALVNYQEGSFDDFSFIQKFVAELKCVKRLVGVVIDETEYNEEWNLNVSEVQQRPLEVLLNHVSPTRLIFVADESKKNYELANVMKYVCRVDISVWLDSIPQFAYGETSTLDKLIKPFLGEFVAPRVDLISGNLSSSMMMQLSEAKATKHLVLLKLKISTENDLTTTLSLPRILPQLMWLEVKIDMNINEINVENIKPIGIGLFDVHVRCLDDLDVPYVSDMLSAMSRRFTGLHLEDTTLTPEGVFTLLKELSKRGISLRAEQEDITKFRRWYYPPFSCLPKWQNPTEEECIELIGHDDREFYSDHHVTSSRFVTALDAWNLRNYLQNAENIVHFVYEASNICFSKGLDGMVDISFKGDYKETIKDKIIDRGRGTDCSKATKLGEEVMELV